MKILGLNAYHGDSAACLFVDGKLMAAAEEERFRRIKHWAGLPTSAINYVLQEAKLSLGEIDHIAINRKPGVRQHDGYVASRLDALAELRAVRRRLGAFAYGLLEACVVDDCSWAALGRRLHIDPTTARSWSIMALRELARREKA